MNIELCIVKRFIGIPHDNNLNCQMRGTKMSPILNTFRFFELYSVLFCENWSFYKNMRLVEASLDGHKLHFTKVKQLQFSAYLPREVVKMRFL